MSPSLRQFMVISIGGMTLLLVALFYFQIESSEDSLQFHLKTHNKNLARVVSNSLLASGLEAALTENRAELPDSIRTHITETLKKGLRSVPIVKVKVFNKDSTVLFSTVSTEIGDSAEKNQAVQSALAGVPMSGIVRRNQINEFDNLVETLSLHQQYIPIQDHLTGKVIGVFEIYSDITSILLGIDNKKTVGFWSIAGILFAFYIALSATFFATNRLLRRETVRRREHLDELRKIHSELEQRVRDRTAELDQSKKFLQAVIDGIANPLLVIRPDFTITLMNNAAKKLIPADRNIDDYRYCYQVTNRRNSPCSGPDQPCSFDQVIKQGCALRVKHTLTDENNETLIVELLTTPLHTDDGKFDGVIEVEHDITELVRTQNYLKDSEARLRAIMDHVPDAILTFDNNGVIQAVNPSAQNLLAGSEADLIGTNLNTLLASDADISIFSPDDKTQRETTIKRLDASEFPAEVWVGPLDPADNVESSIAVVRDITRRIQAQQELESTRQQYFHREKMAAIGQLAAGIIHEVGNPIAAISGAALELKGVEHCENIPAENCPFDRTLNKNIDLIHNQTIRLGRITREIADFASPKPRARELLDLNALLMSTSRLLSYDRRFSDVTLEYDLDKNLPAVVGVADQLTQVFMNLLMNAADACSADMNRDSIIRLTSRQNDSSAIIEFRDNGFGMSKEILGHTLEPFYTTKELGQGSGLGLSLCNTIIEAHGGTLSIESREEDGTNVTVTLPIDLSD